MRKSEIINMQSIGYYSGLNGLEIKAIKWECGEDIVYSVSGAWGGRKTAHRTKIKYNAADEPYFMIDGYRVPLGECIRM